MLSSLVRKILGKRFFRLAVVYRSLFVDLDCVASSISPFIPDGAIVIDIGGGDGAPLNHIFRLRNDICVRMIDIAGNIGGAVMPEFASRLQIFAHTPISGFRLTKTKRPVVVLLSDVIHHIPLTSRPSFFKDLKNMVKESENLTIIIKDVEPGYLRAFAGYLADLLVSGDTNVSLVSRQKLQACVQAAFGDQVECVETELFVRDRPNYALVFRPFTSYSGSF